MSICTEEPNFVSGIRRLADLVDVYLALEELGVIYQLSGFDFSLSAKEEWIGLVNLALAP